MVVKLNTDYAQYHSLPTIGYDGSTYRVYPDIAGHVTWEQALNTCDGLTYGGYSDWILPSKEVLNAMYIQKSEIGDYKAGKGSHYWSSTEYDESQAYNQQFYDGKQIIANKNRDYYAGEYDGSSRIWHAFYARCVRKEN